MKVIERILEQYGALLTEVDAWFNHCIEANPDAITCGVCCSGCCRGLFDITLLDACYLKSGFDRLDAAIKIAILAKANERLASLKAAWPEYGAPYILNHRPDEEWGELMPEDDETPCVLLGDDGACLVYDHRPMTCRLHGVPLIDLSGEIMDEACCSLNFAGVDPFAMDGLRWEFLRLFRGELLLFRSFTEQMMGMRVSELDTLIPSALLVDFIGFNWWDWWRRRGG
ncbi:MAG: YkgJ family cysteine cluster protein [Geobacteraceae bacterium]